jgi:DNA-binding NtrC family response regulator
MAVLLGHDWPGNVRELEHVIQQACACATGHELLAADLSVPEKRKATTHAVGRANEDRLPPLEQSLAALEKTMILDALRRGQGVQTKAAALLGISRRKLKCRMDALGLPSNRDPYESTTRHD